MSIHIVFDISSHGFGHFAQSASVINALHKFNPDFRFTLRTAIAFDVLRSRIVAPFDLIVHQSDAGMQMTSTFDIDMEESYRYYATLHRHFDSVVEAEAQALSILKPDLLVSNISYVSIAAAKKLDVPAVAFCSLNWADIFKGVINDENTDGIYHQIIDCYNQADVFICPEPSMRMPALKNIQQAAPVVYMGANRREVLDQIFPRAKHTRLILVSPGGIPTQINFSEWPRYDDISFIITQTVDVERDDMMVLSQMKMSYIDVLASCDAVLTKPGYGTVSEAMCHRIPVLYACRDNWPEEPGLVRWLQQFGKTQEVAREVLFNGEIKESLDELLAKEWTGNAPLPEGDTQAAKIIAELVC